MSIDRLLLIDVATQEIIVNWRLAFHQSVVAFSDDDQIIALYSSDSDEIQLFHVDDLNSEEHIEGSYKIDFHIRNMEFVSDNLLVIERYINECTQIVSLFDLTTGIETQLEATPEQLAWGGLHSPTLNVDRSLLATASYTGIQFWDLQTLEEVAMIPGFSMITFVDDGQALYIGSSYIEVWRIPSRGE